MRNYYFQGARHYHYGQLMNTKPVYARLDVVNLAFGNSFRVKFYVQGDIVAWYTASYDTFEKADKIAKKWVNMYTCPKDKI